MKEIILVRKKNNVQLHSLKINGKIIIDSKPIAT